MSDFSLLPEDVLINILLRLPIKYVFRSRTVCKNWNSLLRSPHFSSLYNGHQLCRQERLAKDGVSSFIVLEYVENDSFAQRFPDSKEYVYLPDVNDDDDDGDERSSVDSYTLIRRVYFDDEYDSYDPGYLLLSFVTLKNINNELITTVDRVEKLDNLFTSIRDRVAAGHIRFSNVHNGILCLEDAIGVILYNPYTRESQRLSFRPCTPSHYYYYRIVLGLWFESNQPGTIEHYKLFSLLVLNQHIGVLEKYDSIESSWTEIWTMPDQCQNFCRGATLIFNGILHLYVDVESDSLTTFDIKTETFGLLPIPSKISGRNIKWCYSFDERFYGKGSIIESCFVPHLFVIGKCLAIFAENNDISPSCIDIWMMTEYGVKESWTKQYTINQDYIALEDFYRGPYRGLFVEDEPPIWWRLLENWKCMNEDEMILETRSRNNEVYSMSGVVVSFNLLSNKLTNIDICVTGDLLSVVPFVETMLSLK